MNKFISSLSNGYGALSLRIVITVMLFVVSFFAKEVAKDVRSEFSDIKSDMRDVRISVTMIRNSFSALRENVVYKCDYAEDLEHTRHCIIRLEDRLNKQ